MTENERIKKHIEDCEHRIGNILGFMESNSDADIFSCEENIVVLKEVIIALEEIQQYRAIGTIEEFKALKEKSVVKKSDCIENVIHYGTKIIYHRQNPRKDCKCYCGHYNQKDDTYNIFRGWDLAHVPKADIEVFDWK